jgi:hypothetical protein
MTALAADVDALQAVWALDSPLTASIRYVQVEDEVVAVDLHPPTSLTIRVTRASGGDAASHAMGTTLTPLVPQYASTAVDTGGGAGGVSVDNTVDPPASVTGLIAPGALISGPNATISSLRAVTLPIAFDTADLRSPPGVEVATLKAGEAVIGFWPSTTTVFNNFTAGDNLQCRVYRPDLSDYENVGQGFGLDYAPAPLTLGVGQGFVSAVSSSIDGAHAMVYLVEATPSTAGEAVIYVMIATPAS